MRERWYKKKHVIEYIGMGIEVLKSTSKSMIGIKGEVINETKNMFEIEKRKKIVKIPKKGSLFKLIDDKKTFIVDGSKIVYRPEERAKKVR